MAATDEFTSKQDPDVVWRRPVSFGTSLGSVGDDGYVGLALEIPVTVWRTDPDPADTALLIFHVDGGEPTITAYEFGVSGDGGHPPRDLPVHVRETHEGSMSVELDVSSFDKPLTGVVVRVYTSGNVTLNSITDPNVTVSVSLGFHE